MNEALRDWVTNVRDHPLRDRLGRRPAPVSDAGARAAGGDRPRGARADPGGRRAGCPTRCVACVGGGSNAMGLFHAFVPDKPASSSSASRRRATGIDTGRHAATLARGPRRRAARRALVRALRRRRPDLRGALDLRGARLSGRRPRALVPQGERAARATSPSPTTRRSRASSCLARTEGILCALESAHAIAALPKVAGTLRRRRGDDRQRLGPRRQGHGDVSARLGVTL